MAEPVKTPTPEVYANEAKYMESLRRHSDDFDKLLATIPEDRGDLVVALKGVYNVEPDRLLDRDKLARLKEQNESLFKEVSTYYRGFLEEVLGIR